MAFIQIYFKFKFLKLFKFRFSHHTSACHVDRYIFIFASFLCRFVSLMPDGTVFVAFCFLLRVVDALGSSGCETAAFVIVAQEFPDNMASFTVIQSKL